MAERLTGTRLDLKSLSIRLKVAGDGGNRKALLAGIRLGAAPLVEDVRAAARAELPKTGGLNQYVANSPIAVRTRLTGIVGVRIVNTRKNADSSGARTTQFGTDKGLVRHPVFGRPKSWVSQSVPGGWFTKTLAEKAPTVTPFVLAAMKSVAAELTTLGF